MRVLSFSFLLGFWALMVTSVLAWEKEDHEIFDLVSELQAAEGKGTTFYSFLEVPFTATTNEIVKAYRKKSVLLHPDKNPGVKGIQERFARLGVISHILRNRESRERYDFFYKNGVPKWRGTDYYYSRFRPGLGTVLTFLIILTSVLQYLVQTITYKRDLARIEIIVRRARAAAWGPKLIPVAGQRRVRVSLGDEHDEEGEVVGSKRLDMVVDEAGVYLTANGELHLVDASTATKPSLTNTWFITLIKFSFRKVLGFVKSSPPTSEKQSSSGEENSDSDSHASDAKIESNGNNNGAKRVPAGKAGGVRRKNVRRR